MKPHYPPPYATFSKATSSHKSPLFSFTTPSPNSIPGASSSQTRALKPLHLSRISAPLSWQLEMPKRIKLLGGGLKVFRRGFEICLA